MPTRRQSPDTHVFHQAAFASSAENERGILGNLVAARCHKITDRDEIAMLWWLQQVSWRDGGLEKFAEDFIEAYRGEIGPRAMHRFGFADGQVYNADQVREVRAEFPPEIQKWFLLKGERLRDVGCLDPCDLLEEPYRPYDAIQAQPNEYPASAFVNESRLSSEGFVGFLKKALVDPAMPSLRKGLWKFPRLWDALISWRQREIDIAPGYFTPTGITRKISEELDFAFETKSFVLIEGREGIGKSEGARDWCNRHPGQAIYVRLESGSDETTLYRSIARRLGTACSYQRKAVEMRARIQDALQSGHLMLVLDEAHFLWPQSGRSERTVPKRLDWLRTAIIDFGVPVALISTPQFFAQQCDRFRKAGWNSNQIQRRLERTTLLDDVLSSEEAVAVARSYFPAAPARLLKKAAAVSLLTVGRLTTLSHLRKRVTFRASREASLSEDQILELEVDTYLQAKAEPLQGSGSVVAAPQQGERQSAPRTLSRPVMAPPSRTLSPNLNPEPSMV